MKENIQIRIDECTPYKFVFLTKKQREHNVEYFTLNVSNSKI